MDYGTLAQLSNPGQNPIAGPGIVDIQAYRNYQNLATMREQALQKAMPLADMNAQQEAQKNKEFMMGSQGREDMVNLANQKAKDAPATYTRDKLTGDLEHAVKDQDLRNKLAEATENISGDADAYINGDEKLKQAVIDKNRGKRMRNGYVIGDNPEEDHKIFTVAGAVRKYKPELVNKQEVANTAANAKIQTTGMNNATQIKAAQIRADASKQVADINAKLHANKPLSAEEQSLFIAFGSPDGTRIDNIEGATAVMEYKLKNRAAPVMPGLNQKADAATSVMSGGGVNIPQAEPVKPPAPTRVPGPAPLPANAATPKVGNRWQGRDDKGNITNSTIVDVGRNKQGEIVKLKLDNGTVVDYK